MNLSNMLEKFREKLVKINQHYILIWLVVFPPVAIYKCFKYKIFSKRTNIILTTLFILLTLLTSILVIDSVLNPTSIMDEKLKEKLKDKNIGEIRELEYLGMIDEKIGDYEVITTTGFYHVYIAAKDEKNISVEGIKDVITEDIIENSEIFTEIYQNLNPETLEFFIQKPEYQKEIKKVKHEDKYDIITYLDDRVLKFNNEYYRVSKVYEIEDNEEVLIYNRDVLIEFRDDFRRVVNQRMDRFKENKEYTEYVVTPNEIYYVFTNFCDNTYKIIKYNDGSFELQGSNDNISENEVNKLWKTYKEKRKEEE